MSGRASLHPGVLVASLAMATMTVTSSSIMAETAMPSSSPVMADTPKPVVKPPPRAIRVAPKVPDWSGWWYLDLEPHETPAIRYLAKAPFRPEAAAKLRALNPVKPAVPVGNEGTLKQLQCQPTRFAGVNGGFVDDIEFLFSPGRVTLLSELGLVRRIYTGAERPDEADETDSGIAIGHWEGQTLVVDTHALSPNARFGPNWPGVPKIGRNVQMQERIALRDENTLEIVLRMQAPELFTEPFTTTFVYLRDRDHRFHEQSDCVDADRSIDPKSGGNRFDLTPPSGLPPPPKN